MADTFPAFIASIEALKRRTQQGSVFALKEWADDVLQAANAEGVVPRDTGDLMRSGLVSDPQTSAGKGTVTLSYDTHYALKVHEESQQVRKTGIAKWLEVTITGRSGAIEPKLKQWFGL